MAQMGHLNDQTLSTSLFFFKLLYAQYICRLLRNILISSPSLFLQIRITYNDLHVVFDCFECLYIYYIYNQIIYVYDY